MTADTSWLDEPFPMDWDDWNRVWLRFRRAHRDILISVPTASAWFPKKNLMADSVLGFFHFDGDDTPIELSEITFLRDTPNETRSVGVTWAIDGGTETHGTARTFNQLIRLLATREEIRNEDT